MKTLLFTFFTLATITLYGQESDYNVKSYSDEGFKAPNTHYIGEAWLNPLMQADEELNFNITKATFKANSTLDWHKHSSPQILIVVEGEGYYQEKGSQKKIIHKGEVVKCPANSAH